MANPEQAELDAAWGRYAETIGSRYRRRQSFDAGYAAGQAEAEEWRTETLQLISDIRDTIIGTLSLNWPRDIYPLVRALEAAGFKGREEAERWVELGRPFTELEPYSLDEHEKRALAEADAWKRGIV